MIILVLIAGDNAEHATSNHLQNRMRRVGSSVDQLIGKFLRQLQFIIKLSKTTVIRYPWKDVPALVQLQ
jgi:membrane-anchored protein YejM (alkaline phosphatase superfamily)